MQFSCYSIRAAPVADSLWRIVGCRSQLSARVNLTVCQLRTGCDPTLNENIENVRGARNSSRLKCAAKGILHINSNYFYGPGINARVVGINHHRVRQVFALGRVGFFSHAALTNSSSVLTLPSECTFSAWFLRTFNFLSSHISVETHSSVCCSAGLHFWSTFLLWSEYLVTVIKFPTHANTASKMFLAQKRKSTIDTN